MAHSLSAKKRIRQSIKRRARNRVRKEMVKIEVKSFMTVLGTGDAKKAQLQLNKTVQRMDKVAAKHTIHKNAAGRKRSRLQKRLNAMIASGGKPVVEKTSGKARKAAAKP